MIRKARPFAAFLLVVLAFQWLSGAYTKLLDGNYDEASHYLTSLLVRDYLAAGLPGNPLHYAENYYLHYPKIAIGHWPPVFYLVNGVWLLLLPFGPASCFVLLALTTAGLAARIHAYVRRSAPDWAAWLISLLFLTLAPVISSSIELMSEILLAWLVLESCWAFSAWMKTPTTGAGVRFTVWSSLALLTKAVGIGLAFLPPCAILLSRRNRLFAKPSLYLAGILVAAVVGPWYALAPGARHEASGHKFAGLLGVNLPTRTVKANAAKYDVAIETAEFFYRARRSLLAVPILFKWLGPLVIVAMLGAWRAARLGDADAQAVLGVLFGFLIFRFVLVSAAWEPRMLIPVVPPLLCFAWVGRTCFTFRHASACLVLLVACASGYNLTAAPRHAGSPAGEAAAWISASSSETYRTILVSSDGAVEGALAALIADSDTHRPSRYVVRASKLLAVTSWSSYVYVPKATDEDAVLRALDAVPVDLVVLQPLNSKSAFHEILMDRTVQHHPGRFRRIPVRDSSLAIFEVVGRQGPRPVGDPKIDMFLFGLGRNLSTQEGAASPQK
ncbi:ArnT family glycosyltransferase [Paludibaculum fermentans]|uniref:Glycosyltransferase RgtA/B/C/D-like domain-containing protein n=1 Tax=Paludibaculum fermentans TaxID=1473598 RepID=A0A7S7NWJ0_PALFE|nr:hypothetical protein [Paludibaculum fermentans]QOY91046.1 hypothetical protein IRI77_14200 [Paludibaculum fermentans]